MATSNPGTDTDKRVITATGENPYAKDFGPALNKSVDPYDDPSKDPFSGGGFVGVSEYYRNYASVGGAPLNDEDDEAPSESDLAGDDEDDVVTTETSNVPVAPQAPAAPSRGDVTNEQVLDSKTGTDKS